MEKIALLCLVLLILSVNIAGAVAEVKEDGVTSWNVEASDGKVISGLELNNVDPDNSVHMVFDNYGKIYTLDVTCEKSWGWWDCNVTLTYPNGTVQHEDFTQFAPASFDVDMKVQQYYTSLSSAVDSVLDVDLYIGLLPLKASFQDIATPSYSDIAFSEVSGTSSTPGDLIVYLATAEEFQDQQEDDPLSPLSELLGDFFAWTWSAVLAFVSKIPGIGPYLATILEITAIVVGDVVWFFDLFLIKHPETTILTIEFFILSFTLIQAPKNANIVVLLRRIIKDHVKVIKFTYEIVVGTVNMFTSVLSAIANIVNGLKPT